jgi:hypothetical protein
MLCVRRQTAVVARAILTLNSVTSGDSGDSGTGGRG